MAYVFGQPILVGQVPVIPQVPIVPQSLSSQQQLAYQKHPEPLSEEKLQEKGLLLPYNVIVYFSDCRIVHCVTCNCYLLVNELEDQYTQ